MNIKNYIVCVASIVVATGCVLLTGCITKGEARPSATHRDEPPVDGPIPDTSAYQARVEVTRHYNFRVYSAGSGPVDAVRKSVEGKLSAGGYKFNREAPDITVNLNVSASEYDRSGNYIRYKGVVEAKVIREWDSKLLGYEVISINGKRGLGEEEAMRYLTLELADAAAARVAIFARPEQSGLAVVDVTVYPPRQIVGTDKGYPAKFINEIKRQHGVIYCALIYQNYTSKEMVFRIVYYADAFPEGIFNRILNIRSLGINPVK